MFKQIKKQIFVVGAVAAIAFTGTASADKDNELASWAADAGVAVDKEARYPSNALRFGADGTAKYRVTVDRDGNIVKSKRLLKTSHPSLDAAVSRMVRKVDFPALPDDYYGDTMTFALQLDYSIDAISGVGQSTAPEGQVTSRRIASNGGGIIASIEILDGND